MKATATKVVTVVIEMDGWEADYIVKMLDNYVQDHKLHVEAMAAKHAFINNVTRAAREMKK